MHFITGLSVDGLAVTSADPILTGNEELQNYVGRLIGKTPATSYLSSGRIKMSWLHSNFAYREGAIREDDIETIHQYCWAYIVDFFGSCAFADLLGAYAHLFFLPLPEDLKRAGGAALSWIYRELGRTAFRIESSNSGNHIADIGGWMAVVQVWALERHSSIARRVHEKRT
ncbi:Protein MAIN-LIKE 2 [Linum perenne]